MLNIKKGSFVKIITGEDKGKVGKVIEQNVSKSLIKVQGVGLQTRHYKKKSDQSDKNKYKSGICVIERFIHISNVSLVKPE